MSPRTMGCACSPLIIAILVAGCRAPTTKPTSDGSMDGLLQEISYRDQPGEKLHKKHHEKPGVDAAAKAPQSPWEDRPRQVLDSVWTGIRIAGDMVMRTASWTVGAMIDGIFDDDDDDDDRNKSRADKNFDRWIESREKWREDAER